MGMAGEDLVRAHHGVVGVRVEVRVVHCGRGREEGWRGPVLADLCMCL